MPIIGPYKVSNTNSNGSNKSAVRVRKDGILLAVVYLSQRNPLGYIRSHPNSNYRAQLVAQLQKAQVSAEDIALLLESDSKNNP